MARIPPIAPNSDALGNVWRKDPQPDRSVITMDFNEFDEMPDTGSGNVTVDYAHPFTGGLRDMPTLDKVSAYVSARIADIGYDETSLPYRPVLEKMIQGRPVSLEKARAALESIDMRALTLPVEYAGASA